MNDDDPASGVRHDRPRSAPTRRQQPAQASECRCGPRGAARAAGGLLYPANRRMIVVQEPANGESRVRSGDAIVVNLLSPLIILTCVTRALYVYRLVIASVMATEHTCN
jgi:hypothetical protein